MEQRLFILLFLTGVVPLALSVSREYYLIQQRKTWRDAQAYCQANHADLAIIKSNDDMIHLQNEVQREKFNSSAWIGLYNDINSWRWSFGNEPLGSMKKWASGEPNNNYGNQECVSMNSLGWSDRACAEAFPFVCFDDGYTGNYIFVSQLKSWYEAQSYCRQYHTDLASTRNVNEYSAIYNMVIPLAQYTWIGLFRDSWKWIDQTNFSTISWMSGKPDNKLGKENCGYLNNSQAADAVCSDAMPFFCYSLITGTKQVIRVKVRSSQDVNDPAVKAAILEQIKWKSWDHGMAGDITIKWRKQPDGVVFLKKK